MRPEAYGYGLAALVVIGATVLLAMGKVVPAEYWLLAGVGAGGGAGVSFHRSTQPLVDTPSGPAVPTTSVIPYPTPAAPPISAPPVPPTQ